MIKLFSVPGVLDEARFRKEEGEAGSIKRLVLTLNLSKHLDAMGDGARPLWKGVDVFAKAAADGGGPYRVTAGRKIPKLTLSLFGSVPDGKQAQPGKKIASVVGARIKGPWTLHLTANMLSASSTISIVGALEDETITALLPYAGADVFVDLEVLQADLEETAKEKAKAKNVEVAGGDAKTGGLFDKKAEKAKK